MSDFNEQFILRVKRHSDLDIAMRALRENGKMTSDDINALTKHNVDWFLKTKMSKWFDNVSGRSHRNDPNIEMSYVDIHPRSVQVVTSDVNFGDGQYAPQTPTQMESEIRWQLAPPIVESLGDQFDKPSYFETMRKMVALGKHISLEGPPGVGKDTAVQELAAQEGKILITLGGDGGFRKRDLAGSPQIVNGTSFWECGEYVTAAVMGWWVLITEINAADADALIYLNSQLAPPYIVTISGKAYPVHPDFRLFVSYNAGLVGTKPLPQSLKDRFFSIKVPFFSEAQLVRRLSKMVGDSELSRIFVDDDAFGKIVNFGQAMWKAHEDGKFRYQITSRRLYDACVLVMELNYEVKSALKDAVIAAVDSPIEQKAVERVLNESISEYESSSFIKNRVDELKARRSVYDG